MADQENVAQTIIKAIGSVPRAFSWAIFLIVTVLLGIVATSVYLTLFRDCGTINATGTLSLGGHCQAITTSEWRYIPDDKPKTEEEKIAGFLPQCRANAFEASKSLTNVVSSGESVLPSGSKLINDPKDIAQSFGLRTVIVWHQVKRGRLGYDVLYHCQPDGMLLTVSGPHDEARKSVLAVTEEAQKAYSDIVGSN